MFLGVSASSSVEGTRHGPSSDETIAELWSFLMDKGRDLQVRTGEGATPAGLRDGKLGQAEDRIAVLQFFCEKFRKPVPSNVFPALSTVQEVAEFFDKAVAPPPPKFPHLREDLPSNLEIDPKTFEDPIPWKRRRAPIFYRKPDNVPSPASEEAMLDAL